MIVRGLEVRCQLGGDLGRLRAERGHLALGDAAVQPDAPRLRDALVEDVLVERVHEAVASGEGAVGPLLDAGGAQELAAPREPLAAVVERRRLPV